MIDLIPTVTDLLRQGLHEEAIAAIRSSRVLTSTRDVLYLIQREPGLTCNEIVAKSGYCRSTVQHTLHRVLKGKVRFEMRKAPRSDNRTRTVPHWYAL